MMHLTQLMVAALLAASSLTACLSAHTSQPEITLEKDLAFGFGSGLFDLVEMDSISNASQAGTEHVRVAMYRVTDATGRDQLPDTVFSRTLREQGAALTWERIVRVRDDDSQVWVFAGMNLAGQRLETLCVFVLKRDLQGQETGGPEVAMRHIDIPQSGVPVANHSSPR